MNSKTKNKIFLFSVVIILFLAIGNYNSILNSNEKSSNSLEVETEGKGIEQIEIKSSGDNDYEVVWSSTYLELRSLDPIISGDLDKDGKKEIITEAAGVFKVFEYNSTYNNYTKVWSTILGTFYSMCTGEQDGDGKEEMIGGGSGETLYICEYNYTDNDYENVRSQSLVHDISSIGIGDDLDKDGKREIIIIGYINLEGYRLYVYEFNGTDDGYDNVWNSLPILGQPSLRIIGNGYDLDCDGRKEIIFGDSVGKIYVYETDGTDDGYVQVWNSSSIIVDYIYDVYVGDDLDGDGRKEIIAGSLDDRVYVFEYNGTDNGFNKTWDSGSVIGDYVLHVCGGIDLDGDGKKEIIACSSGTDNKVYIFEYNGTDNGYSVVWNSDSIVQGNVNGMCIGEDHNNNGKLEILVSTSNRFYMIEHDDTPSARTTIIVEDDDDDDDEKGIYISTTTLIVGGTISAIAIAAVIILLIKRKR